MRMQPAAVLLGLVAAMLLSAPVAHAHANLLNAGPAPGSELDASPGQVWIEFSEPVERRGSEIRVLDAQGAEVHAGDSRLGPDGFVLTVDLRPDLARGTYTVVWRSLSVIDGHPVQGSFVFAIGEPVLMGAGTESVQSFVHPLEPPSRWVALLGISALVGALVLQAFVIGPGLPRSAAPLAVPVEGRLRILAWAGLAAFAAGSVGHLVSRCQIMESPPAAVLAGTAWGRAWLWRMGAGLAAIAALVLAGWAGRSWPRAGVRARSLFRAAALAAVAGALLAAALTSHVGAGTDLRVPAIVNHYLHLAAASVWVGSLLGLAATAAPLARGLSRQERPQVLSALLSRFWALSILCVAILAVTGIYSSWVQVTAHEAMRTPYGRVLALKVLLSAPLVLLGALDFLWLRPRLRRHPQAGDRLARSLREQTLLAALVLLPVALLASMEPARIAARSGPRDSDPLVLAAADEGTRVTLSVEPAEVGANRLLLDLDDARGRPVAAVQVSVELVDPARAIALVERAVPAGAGRYVVQQVPLSVQGTWEAVVAVSRSDAFDARASFRIPVGTSSEAARTQLPDRPTAWLVLAGLLLLVAALCAAVLYSARALSRPVRGSLRG